MLSSDKTISSCPGGQFNLTEVCSYINYHKATLSPRRERSPSAAEDNYRTSDRGKTAEDTIIYPKNHNFSFSYASVECIQESASCAVNNIVF